MENNKLKRSLKSRHMNMIALGGAIGTGLFVAGGEVVSTAGPGGALVAYGFIGIMVYFLMTSLGEMTTYLPVSGSFGTHASRYVDKALGFALGWNFWFNWAITLAAELVASAFIMKYWFPDVPAIVWSAIFLLILFVLNYFSARSFGESEYVFSSIKVITVIVFLLLGFSSILAIFMIAGFSFQGVELIGTAAGESEDPEKNIPKAVNSIFWRILLFYIGSFIVIGFLIPYNDPNLLNSSVENVSISPFTLVFDRFGFDWAAHFINAILLIAVLSAGNSGLFSSTRMLYAMSKSGDAPKFFSSINHRGVPIPALLATAAFGLFAFLTSLIGEGQAYTWLINISGMSGFITWVGIAIAHYRFRRAYVAQGHDVSKLPYKASLFPFGPLFALALCLIIIAGQNYTAFMGESIDWYGVSVAYIGLPVFFAVYLWYKAKHKTKVVPLKEVNLSRDFED